MKKRIVAVLWFAALFACSCASAPPQDFQELPVQPEAADADGGGQDGSAVDDGAADGFEAPHDFEDGASVDSDDSDDSDGTWQDPSVSDSDGGTPAPDVDAAEDALADDEPDSPGNESALDAEDGSGESDALPQEPEPRGVLSEDDAPIFVSVAHPAAESEEYDGARTDGAFGDDSDLTEKVAAEELPPLPEDDEAEVDSVSADASEIPEFSTDAVAEDGAAVFLPPQALEPGGDGIESLLAKPQAPLADGNPASESLGAPEDSGDAAGFGAAGGIPAAAAAEDAPEKAPPAPSRSMTVNRNQLIEVVYPGRGWIYQGSVDSGGSIDSRNRNFIFGGRKLGGASQSFTLRARQPGTYLLHFYKNDALSGEYIDDYLEVIVGEEQTDSGEPIVAPDYAEIVPPKSTITAETVKAAARKADGKDARQDGRVPPESRSDPSAEQSDSSDARQASGSSRNGEPESASPPLPEDASIRTVVQTTESAPDSSSPSARAAAASGIRQERNAAQEAAPADMDGFDLEVAADDPAESGDDLLEQARKQYEAREYAAALNTVTRFFDTAVARIDEGLYLQGQILEADSDVQNIKGAIDSYDLLVRNWPASALWDDANRRSIFLKRFYINIR